VKKVFSGALFSPNPVHRDIANKGFDSYGNSGAGCISLAAKAGAKRIILLGYDCQHTNGKAHWHGNHPKMLGNAENIPKWLQGFERLASDFKDVEIVNCSRETALKCFKTGTLEEYLC